MRSLYAVSRVDRRCALSVDVPIYLVSPQLLVTKEHISSDSASTSSSSSLSLLSGVREKRFSPSLSL